MKVKQTKIETKSMKHSTTGMLSHTEV